jgi:hypothetical protein
MLSCVVPLSVGLMERGKVDTGQFALFQAVTVRIGGEGKGFGVWEERKVQ